jgi:uncharacterized protein with GYD domain
MLGKYTTEGVKGASGARTKNITGQIEKAGGEVHFMHALLGEYDLAFLVDFPGNQEAMATSFALAKATGIAFSTLPAVTVQEFDTLIGG